MAVTQPYLIGQCDYYHFFVSVYMLVLQSLMIASSAMGKIYIEPLKTILESDLVNFYLVMVHIIHLNIHQLTKDVEVEFQLKWW